MRRLLDHLEKDEALRQKFFARLDLLFYAAAALPQSLWDRLERLGEGARAQGAVHLVVGLTETAPAVTMVHFAIDRPGIIGLPVPGMAVKLAPVGDKLEIRVKGPNVTPGYFKAPELTAEAFDEEGFSGRATPCASPSRPIRRPACCSTAARRRTSSSRPAPGSTSARCARSVIAAGAPVIQDAVVTGHDRDEIGLLIFPSLAGLRGLCPGARADAGLEALIAEPAVRRALIDGLARHNARAQGSSMRIARCLLLTEPPSIDANEITDKGYLNQRAVLAKRAALVERLHAVPAGVDVIVVG